MSLNVLSLPRDIPWKRRCVSSDMNDGELCDGKHPPRWRSSMAVFSYEPPVEEQPHEDMLVSYLKVVCTITGYQAGRTEVGLEPGRGSYWKKRKVHTDYQEQVAKYYACHGALLSVSVAPPKAPVDPDSDGTTGQVIDLRRGPYFADFEPKKRELYELVTETGETMSRSLESANVRKGSTTTDSNEVVDSVGFNANVSQSTGDRNVQQPETTVGAGVNLGNSSRNLNQQEISDVRTSDQGREMRETYSHSTQLTQMYHQLTSYHVGTNRALFLMQPRPHTVQPRDEHGEPVYTFVNGPRELEGIQEFFLVVMRPRGMEDICVEAYLETAHLARVPVMGPKERRKQPWDFPTIVANVENRDTWYDTVDDSYENVQTRTDTYYPPPGFLIQNREWTFNTVGDASLTVDSEDDLHLTATGRAVGRFEDGYNDNVLKPARLSAQFVFDLHSKEQVPIGFRDVLYLTGRGLCCCPRPLWVPGLLMDSVTYEKPIELRLPKRRLPEEVDLDEGVSITEANRMRAVIGREVMASLNSVDRYPRGLVTLAETRFVADTLAQSLGGGEHPDNQLAADVPGLQQELIDLFRRQAPRLRRSQLLRMSPREQQERFGLTDDQLGQLRRAVAGRAGPFGDPAQLWEPETEPVPDQIPDVVGLSETQAKKTLGRAGFVVGQVRYEDSEERCPVVLVQTPEPGENGQGAHRVDLVVSTGAIRLPDVVDLHLTDAVLALRQAGLRTQPEILLQPGAPSQEQLVVEMEPAAGERVSPGARVTLTFRG